MPDRIEHVALAVADLDDALAHMRAVWGLEPSGRERVHDQGVEEATLPLGDSALQLIAPVGRDSTVARFLSRRGEGLHHIALEVDDLRAELRRLEEAGVALIDREPRRGGGGHLVAFVHPRGNLGLLVELVERAPRSG
ncbi:MAG TPA: methylmalonyl-CoA epimerase [Actinomycetota bacterium]|jgi:methylmalonyl-CoA/ethylmalonyl-CoA epimerase|nr:methylmalonyl-CoA epimerase [Actinomycetota bacterium]